MLPDKMRFINPEDMAPLKRVSRTFKLDHANKRVISEYIDGREAVAQAIWINLGIERGVWSIHTKEYGVEFAKYYGGDKDLARGQLESVIKRALAWDERIFSTSNYVIEEASPDTLTVEFDVTSSEGEFRTGVSVRV